MGKVEYITEGSRIFVSSWKNRLFAKRYDGTAEEICREVVRDCWNGHFFQTSTQNFSQFWTRDFGFCASSLIKLGYEKEAQQTLRYAINRFKQYNRITTTITPEGKPFDFPLKAVDSLPWFIHSLILTKFPYYNFKDFLNLEIDKFYKTFINEETGLVKTEHYSSLKDFAVRKSSCYDNCMAAMLAKDLKTMKLDNPLERYNYPELIVKHFWNGQFFYDDLTKQDYIAGDANIFPFLCGVVKDEEMLKSALKAIQVSELDKPFPLKYTNGRGDVKFIRQEFFLRNYESNAVWMHMGPLYVKLMQQVDPEKAKEHKDKYQQLIQKEGNFYEVYDSDGKKFKTPFYYSSPGMLWAANYLTL
jgi:hypothetical protein